MPTTLLREVAAILRDYEARIERLGPEAFRLRGEGFEAWDRKRAQIARVRAMLEVAAEASARRQAEILLREVARCPEVEP